MSRNAHAKLIVKTAKGKVEIIPKFPISRSLRMRIETGLKKAIEDVRPIEELQAKLKKLDPTLGTPASALRTYMELQKWTQKKLAQATGISQGNISEICRGKMKIGIIRAKKLGKALKVDYRQFL